MADLKLGKLPERTPVKIVIGVLPELHARLEAYARLYADTYGVAEPISEMVPAMLAHFLDSDREFVRAERKLPSSQSSG